MHDVPSVRRAAGDELKQLTKEYFGYHGWQLHEHKAFQEFLSRTGLSFQAIGLGHMNLAVRLING